MSILFRVAPDDGLEFFGTLDACGIVKAGSGDMLVEMVDDDLVEKAVHRAADRRHEVEDLSARCAAFQSALDGADLSRDAPHPRDQLASALLRMSHNIAP